MTSTSNSSGAEGSGAKSEHTSRTSRKSGSNGTRGANSTNSRDGSQSINAGSRHATPLSSPRSCSPPVDTSSQNSFDEDTASDEEDDTSGLENQENDPNDTNLDMDSSMAGNSGPVKIASPSRLSKVRRDLA